MTLAMKIQDERHKSETEMQLRDISSLMKNKGITALEAMDWLSIPEKQREKLLSRLPQ